MTKTLPTLFRKSGVYVASPCPETTIIVAPNGQLVTISFVYHNDANPRIIVRDYATGAVLAERAWGLPNCGGGTAIVADGVIYVFAVTPFVGAQSSIVRTTLDANWNMTTPVVVYTATGTDNPCNLGITASPHGFIMSVETQQAARQVFFLKSTNLTNWTEVGVPVATGAYLGSPKIWYSAARNEFFVTFLRLVPETMTFYTTVARMSPSLISFEIFQGDHVLVWPDGAGETKNASDLTMAVKDGITYMVYLDGDQQSYGNYRTAMFLGDMDDLWRKFFPVVIGQGVQQPAPPPPSSGNLIPAMTGTTTSGWTITASDTLAGSTFFAWKAADRDAATFHHKNQTAAYPHWLRIEAPSVRNVQQYAIRPRDGFPAQAPKNFTLRALINGAWTTVDTRSNVSGYTSGQFKTFTLPAPVVATAFEILTTANVEGSANLSFGDVQLIA